MGFHPEVQSTTAKYEYKTLPGAETYIRLLKIAQAPHDGIIHCNVCVWDRRRAPAYVGISYVCGAPEPAAEIIVDDSPMRLRANTEYILRQAFNFDPSRWYWVSHLSNWRIKAVLTHYSASPDRCDMY
jgi:hypothetical protein